MDDKDQFWGEISFALVVGPFILAFALLGCSLALISGRFLFNIATNFGSLPPAATVQKR